jgi:hypothetical protein
MTEANAVPVVVFGKLSGLGLLLIGFSALIASVSFFLHAADAGRRTAPSVPPPKVAKHDFQLTQLGEFRRDQFLVDKSTGRVWQSVCTGDVSGPDCKGMLIWDEMYVDGVTPSDSATAIVYRQFLSRK